MKQVRVTRLNDNRVLAEKCDVAHGVWSRFMGLMGKPCLSEGAGLLLEPCNSIHTFFMRFAIDVVYLDRNYKVLHVRRAMKPWRADLPIFGAHAVLELTGGAAGDLEKGDVLCLS